jgi:hypothetical protein
MPADPIEFRIVKSLQAALRLIATSGGYHYTVQGLAVKLDPEHEIEKLIPGADPPFGPPRPFFVLDMTGNDAFEYPERSGRVRRVMPVTVFAIHDSDPTDDDSKLEVFNRLCADIETALVASGSHGGLSMGVTLRSRRMHDREGQEILAQVSGEVPLHRRYGFPNDP